MIQDTELFDMRQDLIFTRLLAYALTGGTAPDVSGADWALIYGFSRLHGVQALLYRALLSPDVARGVPPAVLSALKKSADISSSRYLHRRAEELYVLGAFDGAGIDCMPVKGSQLAEYYPSPELRDSCDVDILIPQSEKKRADGLMCACGFTRREVGVTETSYEKAPGLLFEIHTALGEEKLPVCLSSFPPGGENGHIRAMTPENAYIYVVCHAAKHLRGAGCGIRFALDCFAMRNGAALERGAIDGALNEVGLKTFGESVERLCDFWFCGAKAGTDTEAFAAYVLSSGRYGTPENAAVIQKMNESKRTGRGSHFFGRLFPPYSLMVKTRPYLKKCPLLLPYAWAGRIIRSSPEIKRKAKTEKAAYDRADAEAVGRLKALFNGIGLR